MLQVSVIQSIHDTHLAAKGNLEGQRETKLDVRFLMLFNKLRLVALNKIEHVSINMPFNSLCNVLTAFFQYIF